VVGQRTSGTCGPEGQGFEQAPPLYSDIISRLESGHRLGNREAQVSIYSNSSTDCKNRNRKWKCATGNRK